MASGIQVLHIEKRISIASGLNRHITRQQFVKKNGVRAVDSWVPDNADPNRTAGNVELISRERVDSKGRKFALTLQQAVALRIQEARVKPRKGQSTCLEMIFSGSHDVMTTLSRGELLQWAKDTLTWAQDTWGKNNVVSASLHVDELTPHIHMIVVPIVKGESRRTRNHKQQNKSSKTYNIDHNRLRLCVNEVYTQGKLYEYHDSYAKNVSSKYGLSRGVKAEPGSKKKHTNSIEYNRMLAAKAAEQEALIASIQSDYSEKRKNLSDLQVMIKDKENAIIHNNSVIKQQKSKFEDQKHLIDDQGKQIAKNKNIIEDQENKISSMSQIALESISAEMESRLAELKSLNTRKVQIEQQLAHLSAEVEIKKASLDQVTEQLRVKANLKAVPEKGILGYKTEDVDSFITRVSIANLVKEINKVPLDMSSTDSRYYEEVVRLQNIENDYNRLWNSPDRLQARLEDLKDQEKKIIIKKTIEYVLKKTVSSVLSCEIVDTPEGTQSFATFRLQNDPKNYVVFISPGGNFNYTYDQRITSWQDFIKYSEDSVWYNKGNINEIRKRREQERAAMANQSESRGRGMRR